MTTAAPATTCRGRTVVLGWLEALLLIKKLMRHFFDLTDDVNIVGRWHLGEIRASDGTEPRLRAGIPFTDDELHADVTHAGRALEFALTSFAVPVVTAALGAALARAAGSDVQRLSLRIREYPGFEVLNALRIVNCVDEHESEYIKWTERDHRADLAGQYRQITRLHLDPTRIPESAHFFRLEGWRIGLIVSQRVKDAMEAAGCRGARFELVC